MLKQSIDVDRQVALGVDCTVDEGVLLGYRTGRKLDDYALQIGSNAFIRAGSIIYGGTCIGSGLQTGHNVVIREQNQIGNDLNIWNHSTIDYGCVIGDGVKIHCSVYIAQFTVLEDDVFLAPGVMVANDPHPLCGECMRGPTIRQGARIGINVTLLPHITIGAGSLIGAGSVVTKDIPDGVVVYGNPARVVKSVEDLECSFGYFKQAYLGGLDGRAQLRRYGRRGS